MTETATEPTEPTTEPTETTTEPTEPTIEELLSSKARNQGYNVSSIRELEPKYISAILQSTRYREVHSRLHGDELYSKFIGKIVCGTNGAHTARYFSCTDLESNFGNGDYDDCMPGYGAFEIEEVQPRYRMRQIFVSRDTGVEL